MASIPHQFYDDYTLPSDIFGYTAPAVSGGNGCGAVLSGAMWGTGTEENLLVPFCDNAAAINNFDDVVSPESDISSSVMAASFPELLGFSENIVVPDAFLEYGNMGLHGIAAGLGINSQNFGGDHHHQYQAPYMCESREECCGFNMATADFKPLGLAHAQQNWGIHGNLQNMPTIIDQDQSNMKVGRYSEEERKERIDRYLKKRNQRNFNKTIKYACRKTLADRRVRVRGRFARNTDQLSDHDHDHQETMAEAKNIESNHTAAKCKERSDHQLFCNSAPAVQMKYDEDDWLQEAMISLLYLPYGTTTACSY